MPLLPGRRDHRHRLRRKGDPSFRNDDKNCGQPETQTSAEVRTRSKSPSHFVTVHGLGYKFVHEEFESEALARLQSSQAGVRKNTGWEGEWDGAELRNTILGYLSAVYELLARNYPQGSILPEGARQSIVPEALVPVIAPDRKLKAVVCLSGSKRLK